MSNSNLSRLTIRSNDSNITNFLSYTTDAKINIVANKNNISSNIISIGCSSYNDEGFIQVNDNKILSFQNNSNCIINSHFIPASNEVFDLGTSNTRWKDLYLSGNTIYFGDAVRLSVDTETSTLSVRNINNQESDISSKNLKFTEFINNTSSNELEYLKGVTSPIQQHFINISNYISTKSTGGGAGGSSQWTTNNNTIYYNLGNVGIGSTIPTENLDVVGNIIFTGSINNITSNELNTLSGIKNNIQTQLDTSNTWITNLDINQSNNIIQTSNQILNTIRNLNLSPLTSNIDYISYSNIQIYPNEIKIYNPNGNTITPYIQYNFTEDPTTSQPTSILYNYGSSGLSMSATVYNANTSNITGQYPFNSLENLVAWYKFDDNSTNMLLDSSGNNNLTNYGTSFENINYLRGNGAILFNGSSYLEIENDGRFSPDNFSICCWCRIVQPPTDTYISIASCRNVIGTITNGWIIYIVNNNLQLWTGQNTSTWSGVNVSIYNNFATNPVSWRHLALTINKSTNTAILYVDGILVATLSRTYVNNTTTNLRIGAGMNELTATYFLPNGSLIDDFRIYNRVLTANEVKQLMGFTITKQQGRKVNTYAYYWNGLTVNNTYDNAYIELPKSTIDPIITSKAITVAAWIKNDNLNNQCPLYMMQRNTNNYYIEILQSITGNTTGSRLIFSTGDIVTTYTTIWNSVNEINKWIHYAYILRFESATNKVFVKLYKNGVLQTAASGGEFTITNFSFLTSEVSSYARIGNNNNTTDLSPSYIQDFRIYNQELSLAQIRFLADVDTLVPTYSKLTDEVYITNTSNEIISIISNTISNTSSAISNTSNIISNRITTLNTNQSNYILTTSNIISNRITNLTADQIANGTNNKFIVNNTYNNNLTVNGTLTASNLSVIGNLTNISTINYQTENVEIISQSSDGPAMKLTQYGSCNLIDVFDTTSNVFTINKGGNVGIGSTIPIEKLDIVGNIKFTGSINNITNTELGYLSGTLDNIQTQFGNIYDYTSNNITTSSNLLIEHVRYTSNILINNIQEFTTITSNILVNTINNENINTSNYIDEQYSILNSSISLTQSTFQGNLTLTSNSLVNYADSAILNTCNILDNKINNLSILNDAELRWGANPGYVYYSNVQVHPTEIRVYNPNYTLLNTYAYYAFENQNLLLVDSSPYARTLVNTGSLEAQYIYDNGRNSIALNTNVNVIIPSINWNSYNDLTISGWFKTYSSRNNDKLFNFDNSIQSIYRKYPRQNLTNFIHIFYDSTYEVNRIINVAESSRYNSDFGWYLFSTAYLWTTNGGYSGAPNYTATNTTRYFANDSTFWGEWVMIDLYEYIYFDRYRIYPHSELNRAPRDFRIYATNDDSAWNNTRSTSWVLLDEELNISNWVNGSYIEFLPNSSNIQQPYRYFAIIINKNNGGDAYVRFNEWEIYGRNTPKNNNIKLLNNNSNLSFQFNNTPIYETPIINENWNYILWNILNSSNQQFININNTSNIYYNTLLNKTKYPREPITSEIYVNKDNTVINISGGTRLNTTTNNWYNAFNSNINDEGWISDNNINGLKWTKWNNLNYSGIIDSSGIHTNISGVWNIAQDNFTVEYIGLFYTQAFSGQFTFNISSDNGSQLWLTINGIETSIVFIASIGNASGNINLNANTYYPIRIRFYESTAASSLTVSFTPPGQASRTNGTGFYFINHIPEYRGDYIQIDLGESTVINNYVLYANSNNLIRAPKNFRLYGSTNNSAYANIYHPSWTMLDDEIIEETYYQKSINFNNSNAYRYYALIVNGTFDNINSNLTQIAELELYGYPNLSYVNNLGDVSNIGSVNISDIKIITTELTSNIQNELYNPTPTYIKLADENYVQNLYSNISLAQWAFLNNDISYTSGNVGIGAPAYGYKLNVNGSLNVLDTITTSGNIFAGNIYMNSNIVSTHWTQINTNLFYNLSGNIGIGTSTISSKLHIGEITGTQSGANSGSIIIDHANNGGASSITFRSAVNRGGDYGYIQYQDTVTVGGAGETAKLIIGTQNDGDDDIMLMPSGNLFILPTSGNVGIGTSTIQSRLTINPLVIDANSFNHNEAPVTITNQTATSATILNDPKSILHLCRQGTSSQAFGSKASFKLSRWENTSTFSRSRLDITLANDNYDDSNILSIRSDSRIGIGKTNPSSTLDVNGNITATRISAFMHTSNIDSGILSMAYGGLGVNILNQGSILVGNQTSILQPANLIWNNTTSRLGIGTSQPRGFLDVYGNSKNENGINIAPSIIFTSNITTGIDIERRITSNNNIIFNPLSWYQFNENPLSCNLLLDNNTGATKYNLNIESAYNITNIAAYNIQTWYKFDNNASDMLLDSSGNGYSLINTNCTFDSNIYEIGNGSIYLSGSGAHVEMPSSINPYNIWLNNGITFAIWFKMNTTSGTSARILDFSDNAIGINPTNYISINKNTTATTLLFNINGTSYTSPSLIDNTWHHIVWSISSTGVWFIYIDGVYYNPNINTRTIPNATWTKRFLGRSGFSVDGWYIGNIDDFRIYNRVFTVTEAAALFNINGNINNAALWYKFDGNSTNMLLDTSGNAFHAYNSGGATFDSDPNDYKTGDGSMYFNGTNQYIDISSNVNISTIASINGITFSTWFKMSPLSADNARIFDFGDGGLAANPTNYVSVYKNGVNSNLVFNINATTFTTTLNYADNNIHHLAWCISTIGEWVIFMDNQYIYPNNTYRTIPNPTWTKRYLGRSSFTTSAFLTGNIDDFRIYNRVLTTSEVSDIYNQITINQLQTISEEYPPIALNSLSGISSSGTQTLTGFLYGNGSYTVSASTVNSATYPISRAFDKLNPAGENYWASINSYNTSTGIYTGSVSTSYIGNDLLSSNYLGEWIQIQLPYNIILSSYLLISQVNSSSTVSTRGPRNFILLGSINGINWNLLDSKINISQWGTTGIPKVFTISNNILSYSYYRLCINANQSLSTGAVTVSEWELFGIRSLTIEKTTGYTLNNYSYTNAYLWNGISNLSIDNMYLTLNNADSIQTILNNFHNNNGFGIHFVFRTTNISQTSQIIYIGNTSSGDIIRSFISGSDGKLYFKVGALQISTSIQSNSYYVIDLIFSYSANNMTLSMYIDGTLISSGLDTYNNILSNVSTTGLVYYIGRYTDINDASPIILQDYRIFANTLSSSEILSLQSGSTNWLSPISTINEKYGIERWMSSSGYYNNGTKYISYMDGNVGIGSSIPTEKLDIVGNIKVSGNINNISSNELNYLSETTTNINTNFINTSNWINSKQDNIIGTASSIATTNLTADKVMITDSTQKATVSSISSTELGYLSETTTNINTNFINTSNWINSKQNNITGTASSIATTNLTADKVMITDGLQKAAVSSISTTELEFLTNTTKNINTNFIDTSNYINNIDSRLINLNADNIANGTSKKFIINNEYNYPLTINDLLTASNLHIYGTTTTINTTTYKTENLEIDTSAIDGPALKIIQNGIKNIVEYYDTTTQVFTIKKSGNVGIGNTDPLEKLDIIGNIKFTGNINDITAIELSYLDGITTNINTNFINTSNWINSKQNNITGTASSITTTNLTADKVMITDSLQKATVSSISSIELGYLTDTSTNINTNFINTSNWINSKQNNITGTASSITITNLTADKVMITNGLQKAAVSSISTTELSHLSETSTNINTNFINTSNWINSKQNNITGSASSIATINLSADKVMITDSLQKAAVSSISTTELSHLSETTTNINTNFTNTSNWITNLRDSKQNNITGTASSITTTNLTANKVMITDGLQKAAVSSISTTELSHLSETTTNINTNFINTSNWINSKQNNITGTASSITTTNLTADKVMITDGLQKAAVSSISATELGFLTNTTTNINTNFIDTSNWINSKQNNITGAASSITTTNLNNNIVVVSDGSGKITNSGITSNELSYLIGTAKNINTNFINTSNWIAGLSTGGASQWTTGTGLIYYNSGTVGIGKTNPDTSYKLDITGNVYVSGSVFATGNITASYSDIRLKEIVGNIQDPLEKIMKVNTFKYKPNQLAKDLFICNNDEIQVGLSAQDVREILPEVVSLAAFDTSNIDNERVVSKTGEGYLTVSYERMVPLLIECIKQLNERIKNLESRL
jgi:hypothetical protein